MKIRDHIYYYEGRSRQKFAFEKTIGGKRISRRFRTQEEAEDFAKKFEVKIHEEGINSIFVATEDRTALKQIRQRYGEVDLLEMAKFWYDYNKEVKVDVPDLETCWMQFFSWLERSGRSDLHIKSITTAYHHFMERFRGRTLGSIRKQDLLDWILCENDLSPRTKKNLWANTRNFLSWCYSAKGWLADVPKIDERLLPREVKAPVAIWTYEEAKAAMHWIEQNAREFVPFYALRLFVGLRTEEAKKMRWEWIDFENHRITVPAHICKTRDSWVILPEFLPETVFHWLKPFYQKKGDIKFPCNRQANKVAKNCGWKQNVMRHTFATMHVAFYHDEGKTILATRHTNIATLRSHYRGVNQTQEDAKKFFALRPETTTKSRTRALGF